jgi:hypothetical protein
MKRIYCELHLFDLNQTVYIVNPEVGEKEAVAMATLEELPEVISAISNSKNICKVTLSGNSIFGDTMAKDILAYSKIHYGCNNLEIEVLK